MVTQRSMHSSLERGFEGSVSNLPVGARGPPYASDPFIHTTVTGPGPTLGTGDTTA